MQKIPVEVYSLIDNEYYNSESDSWWKPDTFLNMLRTIINPSRVRYSKMLFEKHFSVSHDEINVLEVGCGGGILCEEIAEMGFNVTGIDPSGASLRIALKHSIDNNLKINYKIGTGEDLQFDNNSFDIVLCCDVLEHVRDLPKVISEISRVLKNRGIFIYDTFNRTLLSKIGIIKILQEWQRWAVMPPNLHVWKMFIKPDEIQSLLEANQLVWKEHRGIKPNISYFKMLHYLRKRASGDLTNEEFGKKFLMVESSNTKIMYMGYAVKDETKFNPE